MHAKFKKPLKKTVLLPSRERGCQVNSTHYVKTEYKNKRKQERPGQTLVTLEYLNFPVNSGIINVPVKSFDTTDADNSYIILYFRDERKRGNIYQLYIPLFFLFFEKKK